MCYTFCPFFCFRFSTFSCLGTNPTLPEEVSSLWLLLLSCCGCCCCCSSLFVFVVVDPFFFLLCFFFSFFELFFFFFDFFEDDSRLSSVSDVVVVPTSLSTPSGTFTLSNIYSLKRFAYKWGSTAEIWSYR